MIGCFLVRKGWGLGSIWSVSCKRDHVTSYTVQFAIKQEHRHLVNLANTVYRWTIKSFSVA